MALISAGDWGDLDEQRVAAAVREIIEAIGEDPEREGLGETPRRIAEMYAELFAGLARTPTRSCGRLRESARRDGDPPRHPLLLPLRAPLPALLGAAHVGYIPNGRVVGISKLARVVDASSPSGRRCRSG